MSLEELLSDLARLEDPKARQKAREAMSAVLELHREGLAQLLEIVETSGRAGADLIRELTQRDAVASLLLLHGLHPVALEARVQDALKKVSIGPRAVRLLGVHEGVVRLGLEEQGAAGARLKRAVDEALCMAAPDAVAVEFESDPEPQGLIPVERLHRAPRDTHNGELSHPGTTCEFCSLTLGSRHDHVVNPSTRALRCACQACALLFAGPGGTKWKRVPRRVDVLMGFQISDAQWDALRIPIELAFIYRSSAAGRTVAFYPSPAGATESLLALDAWDDLIIQNTSAPVLEPDTDAILINRARGRRGYYRVSIDVCYELVGRIRRHWRGLGGGTEMWADVDRFFSELDGRGDGVAHA
jgi:hypothetical protein